MPPSNEFLFLISTPNLESHKVLEQEDSQARAHAARKSHAKRRLKAVERLKRQGEVASQSDPMVKWQHTAPFVNALLCTTEIPQQSRRPAGAHLISAFNHYMLPSRTLDSGHGDPFDTFSVHDIAPYMSSLLEAGE